MSREATRAVADDLFEAILSDAVTIWIAQPYRLEDIAKAHAGLEGRRNVGSSILTLGH